MLPVLGVAGQPVILGPAMARRVEGGSGGCEGGGELRGCCAMMVATAFLLLFLTLTSDLTGARGEEAYGQVTQQKIWLFLRMS